MDLKILRTSRGISQKTVSDILGCSTTVYSRYETGTRKPPIDVLISLADYYGITMDELVGRVPIDMVKKQQVPPQQNDDLVHQLHIEDTQQDKNQLEHMIREVVRQELEKKGL